MEDATILPCRIAVGVLLLNANTRWSSWSAARGGVPDLEAHVTSTPEVRLLLALLDRAYNQRSWHGTNLRGSIRGMSPGPAAWRPGVDRHNIWEIVVHAAYWKYAVWRRLSGARRGSFPLEGSDWFPRPVRLERHPGPLRTAEQTTARAWTADVTLLDRMHGQLRDHVARMSPRELGRRSRGSPFTHAELVSGAAAHDLYHAGQIQLLKRLQQKT